MKVADLLPHLPPDQREAFRHLFAQHLRDLVFQVPQRHRRDVVRHIDGLVDLLVSEGFDLSMVADLVLEHVYNLADYPEPGGYAWQENWSSAFWRRPDHDPPNTYAANVREWYAEGDHLVTYAQLLGHAESWVLATTLEESDEAREQLLAGTVDLDEDRTPVSPEPIGSTVLTNAPPATAVRGAMARCLRSEAVTAAA